MRHLIPTFPVVLLLCVPALAATHTVQPGQSIQSAVNAANPGDIIVVNGGTYGEQVVIGSNTNGVPLNGLALVGTHGATLNGPGVQSTNGITISANNVTIRGFTIEQYGFGIFVSDNFINNTSGAPVTNTSIYNNFFTNNINVGIIFDSDVAGADFHDNIVTASGTLIGGSAGNNGFGDGVDINLSTGVHVHSNLIYNNASLGIDDGGQVLTDNSGEPITGSGGCIDHNTIYHCGGGGMYINGAIGQTVSQNIVSGNAFSGILVTNFSANCTISQNIIDGNSYDGLEFDAAGGTQCTVTHNYADYNGHDGFDVVYAPEFGSNVDNVFTNDEAQGNTNFDAEDVSPTGTNTWKHDRFGKTNPPGLGK